MASASEIRKEKRLLANLVRLRALGNRSVPIVIRKGDPLVLTKKKRMGHLRRRKRVRQKISGTGNRPRLSVFRSSKHIYAQLINDELGVTVAEASTLSAELKETLSNGGNVKAAESVGALIAQKAKQKEIEIVVFDRGGHLYHGRIKALAEAAKAEGLKF